MTSNLAFAFLTRPKKSIENRKDETFDVEDTVQHELLFMRGCDGCQITIKSPVVKLIIERCQGTRLRVQGGVASGTIEIIRCGDFELELVSTVPTISVDDTVTLHITALAPSSAENQQQTAQQLRANSAASVYTTHSFGVSLRLVEKQLNPDQPQTFDDTATVISSYSIPSDTNVGGEVTQYVSQLMVGHEFRTEMVVREGAGYATTARAKQEADEREERNRTLLEGFLRNAVNTNPPHS